MSDKDLNGSFDNFILDDSVSHINSLRPEDLIKLRSEMRPNRKLLFQPQSSHSKARSSIK